MTDENEKPDRTTPVPAGVVEFEKARQAEEEKIHRGLIAIAGRARTKNHSATMRFLERCQAEFEKYWERYADLAAEWKPLEGWFLRWGKPTERIEVPKECEWILNALARKALTGLLDLSAVEMEPWQAWVEFMHYKHWPFEVTTLVPVRTERAWERSGNDDVGRPVWSFRDEVKCATDEPDKWRYGLLLEQFFKASGDFCLELAGENAAAFASSRANPEEGNPGPSAVKETLGPTNDSEDDDSAGSPMSARPELEPPGDVRRAQNPQVSRKKRRVRPPKPERRDAIRTAVNKQGETWREHLDEIFTELDKQQVPLGDFRGMKIDLPEGKSARAWTWTEIDLAEGAQRKQIIDMLRKYAD